MPRLPRLALLLSLLAIVPWLPSCARTSRVDALTPARPGQLDEATASADDQLDGDPIEQARAHVEALSAAGHDDLAAKAAWTLLQRAEVAWWIARMQDDRAAIKSTRAQLDRVVGEALRWSKRGDDPRLTIKAILLHPHPRRHRRALRRAVPQISDPGYGFDQRRIAELVGNDPAALRQIARWSIELSDDPPPDLEQEPSIAAIDLLAAALHHAVHTTGSATEIRNAAQDVLVADPWHPDAQVLRLLVDEVQAGLIEPDPLLWGDVQLPWRHNYGPDVAVLSRLHLRARDLPRSEALPLALAWNLLGWDMAGDAHARLQSMSPTTAAGTALHAQLSAMVAWRRGELTTFEQWREAAGVGERSASLDTWLGTFETEDFPGLRTSARTARRRRNESDAPYPDQWSTWVARLDDALSPKARERAAAALLLDRGEARAWESVCRARNVEASACYDYWAHEDPVTGLSVAGRTEDFHPDFLLGTGEMSAAELTAIEPVLAHYRGTVTEAYPATQDALLRIELATGAFEQARTRLTERGALLSEHLRRWAWLAIDELEAGTIDYDTASESWQPAFSSDPLTYLPGGEPVVATRLDRQRSGMLASFAGRHAQALEWLTPIIDDLPDELVTNELAQAAWSAHQSGDAAHRDALRHRLRAVDPHGVAFAQLEAAVLASADRHEQARAAVMRALRWHPDDVALRETLRTSWRSGPVPSDAVALGFLTDGAPSTWDLTTIRKLIRSGEIETLAQVHEVEAALKGKTDNPLEVNPRWAADAPTIVRHALHWTETEIGSMTDAGQAKALAGRALDWMENAGGPVDANNRQTTLWLALLADRPDLGLQWCDLRHPDRHYLPKSAGDPARLLLRSRAAGEIDDALAWDIWHWIYDTDAEASARVDARTLTPPAGSVFEAFACAELAAHEDKTEAVAVCAAAWKNQPYEPSIAVNQLYMALNDDDQARGNASARAIVTGPALVPTFADQPGLAAGSNLARPWHQNRAVWFGGNGRSDEAAEAWWQAYAFGLDDDAGDTTALDQLQARGPQLRALFSRDDFGPRRLSVRRSRLALAEPDTAAALAYADAAAMQAPVNPGAQAPDDLELPDRLRHIATWATAELATGSVEPAAVGPICDEILNPNLVDAQRLRDENPRSDLAALALVRALRDLDDLDAARPLAEALLEAHPNDPLAVSEVVPLAVAAGDDERARALFEASDAAFPDDAVLLYVDAPESITGPHDGVPSWVRDPARFDRRLAKVGPTQVERLAPRRHTSEEGAAELFAPISWVEAEGSSLRFTDERGARALVITGARASRCQGITCAQSTIDELAADGRTVHWTRETTLAGAPATQVMFSDADEVLVLWVMPTGGHVFTLVFAAPLDRFNALVPAMVMARDGFRPLDGVLAPFAAQSLRATGRLPADPLRWRARQEQSNHDGDGVCPIEGTLAALSHGHQRASIMLDLWLATARPEVRRQLLHCARPGDTTARRIATIALLDEDPRAHAYGRDAVMAHATQVDRDVRAILATPLTLPVSAPDYLLRDNQPGHGIIEVISALPEAAARAMAMRLLRGGSGADRALAWAAVRLRPDLATSEMLDVAFADDPRVMAEAAYLLTDRGTTEDAQRLRSEVDRFAPTDDPALQRTLAHYATALAMFLHPDDRTRLTELHRKIVVPPDATPSQRARAESTRGLIEQSALDHERGLQLAADPDEPISDSDGRALRWRDRKRRLALPFRSQDELEHKSLAELLPGGDWSVARLSAPRLFSSTVADVAVRLTTGDEALDQRLVEVATSTLREGGFALLAEGGGLDPSRPIECASHADSSGWVCTATVVDRHAALAEFSQRDWGDDSGVHLPLALGPTAGAVPIVLTLLPVILHEVIYGDDDDDEQDDPDKGSGDSETVYEPANERSRISITRGSMQLDEFSIVQTDNDRISIDSERYLFVGDRLWVFATDGIMDSVLRTHDGPSLADNDDFAQLTASWKGGAALQAVAVNRAWELGRGGGSSEIVVDESGLHFRYAGAIDVQESLTDVRPALALLPPGAISVFAHGLGAVESLGTKPLTATGPDAARLPPVVALTRASAVAFGWYFEDGDRLWRHWLAAAPMTPKLRAALRADKTVPGRGKSKRYGGLCYREQYGHLLVGDCTLVDKSAALPAPPPASSNKQLGQGTFDAAAVAERLPGLEGLPTDQEMILRAAAPLLQVVADLEVGAEWIEAKQVAVVEGHLGFNLRPADDHHRVIDDWLASTESKNAAGLPRRMRAGEIDGPLRFVLEVPDADKFVRNSLGDSPRIQAKALSPTRVQLDVRPTAPTSTPLALADDEYERLTKATSEFTSDVPEMVTLANSVVPADADAKASAEAISTWVNEKLTYEVTPRLLSGSDILSAGRGDCTEYATLTVTLLRARGIPAEIRSGMAASGDEMVAHAWVAYHDGGAWHEIDPTWGRPTASAGHLEISVLDALALISLGKLRVIEVGAP